MQMPSMRGFSISMLNVRMHWALMTLGVKASKVRKTGSQQKRNITELNLLRACQ
jgi:hypothetical protein